MEKETAVVIIDDELFDAHIPISDLPEKPRRTQGIRRALRTSLSHRNNLVWLAPVAIARDALEEVHSPGYVKHVYDVCGRRNSDCVSWISRDPEVLVSQGSLQAILHAAGAAQQAVRIVLDEGGSARRVFCNVRPPGHHAERSKGGGFCIFNNVWIAACEARKMGAERVAIVDWDVHHGNGTQDFILNHPEEANTLFFSIHQNHKTLWPGTGKERTRGNYGTVRCGEMMPGEGDDEMKQYFASILLPELTRFKPDIILISCGVDGHVKDQIAKLRYSSALYGWMTDRLVEVAKQSCKGRIVSILEGGYCVPALEESAVQHVEALLR